MPKDFDPTKHILVSKHSKLSEQDKKQLFERYNITIKELPQIKLIDPAIKNLNLKAGDVVKIERFSPTAGKTVFYRGVSDA